MKNNIYRQGDVLIIGIDEIPQNVKKIKGKSAVLAFGEATGHSHEIKLNGVEAFTDADSELTTADYIAVKELIAEVQHLEKGITPTMDHDSISIPKGNYRVIRQSAYSRGEFKNVSD